jgi:alkanesulfonate monooxygenase SsuD/methylene tetrahydromethanopterin reductase-like flavin-dependent oxidoreductase (luciferase family)
MIPFGLSFDGFVSASEAVKIAKDAEGKGASSFWVAEHLGYRESLFTATMIAQGTQKARVVLTSISPYLRHPMPTAMALASFEECFPGRIGIALGTGNPMFLRESGLAIEKPIAAVRDYANALRDLFTGEAVRRAGVTFNLDGARLGFTTPSTPEIAVAAMGPKMLELAGQLGAVVLSAGLTTQFVKRSLDIFDGASETVRPGTKPGQKSSYIYFIVGGDKSDQIAKVKQKLAFLFRNENIRENITSSGIAVDHEAVMAAIAVRDVEKAVGLIPDEAAEAMAIVGDAEEGKRRAREYLDAGLDELVLSLIGAVDDKARSLSVIASF